MPLKVRILSFDADGCLFHSKYIDAKDQNVILHNQAFLKQIKTESAAMAVDKVISMVGSNRQSKQLDDSNRFFFSPYGCGDKGSCFTALKTLSEYLGSDLDPLLLADIFSDLPAGTSYDIAMQVLSKITYSAHDNFLEIATKMTAADAGVKHPQTYFDTSKVTLLYAQIHKTAIENPTADIIYDFYDDRSDILEMLRVFFGEYPEFIPENVTLRLNQYDGSCPSKLHHEIRGTGFIDSQYRETVKDMIVRAFSGRELSFAAQVSVADYFLLSGVHTLPHRTALVVAPTVISEQAILPSSEPQKDAVLSSDSINPFFAKASAIDSTPALAAGNGAVDGSASSALPSKGLT